MEARYQNIADPLSNKIRTSMLRHFDRYSDFRYQVTNVLLYYFKNSKTQCLFYSDKLNKFFGNYLNQNQKPEIREVMFDEEALPIIQEYLIKLGECLIKDVDSSSKESCMLTSFCERCKQNSHNYLKALAGIAFWKEQ
jgi:hypothetical protein